MSIDVETFDTVGDDGSKLTAKFSGMNYPTQN